MGDPRGLAPMLVSEHALPQDQNAQDGPQHQSVASPLDQLLEELVQYQPLGNAQTPLTTDISSKNQPLGNCTSGNTPAQYLPSGEGRTSRNIAGAPLTQPFSGDGDAGIPAALLVHDMATPRRQVGSRCRMWAVGQHNRLQTSANVLPAARAVTNSAVVKHDCNKWSNRNSHCAFVDAQCVNGGVAHDHELHPKQPTDQDAVEYVARQRLRHSGCCRLRDPPHNSKPGSSLHSGPCRR